MPSVIIECFLVGPGEVYDFGAVYEHLAVGFDAVAELFEMDPAGAFGGVVVGAERGAVRHLIRSLLGIGVDVVQVDVSVCGDHLGFTACHPQM